MTVDAVFRIASQTKLIVTIAALQLVAKEKINLDTPIENWLPEFKTQQVAVKKGTEIELVERNKSITLRHLLSHTSGISSADEWPQFAALFKQYQLEKPLNFQYKSLEEEVKQIAKMPLVHQPGQRFSYGTSTDVLARWVEVVSKMKLSSYLNQYILAPLNMNDTYFKLPASKYARLLPVHVSTPTGSLMKMGNQFFPIDFPIMEEITMESGAGGMVSTPHDYLKLLVCLVNNGEYGKNKRLLPANWVDSLSTGQLNGEVFVTGGIKSKNTFGLGVGVTTSEGGRVTGATPGSFFWGGAFNTSYLVDRKKRIITIFMFQRAPFDLPRTLSYLEKLAFDAIK
jgi:CubicO group peptidase (beta-lactamase class C family)